MGANDICASQLDHAAAGGVIANERVSDCCSQLAEAQANAVAGHLSRACCQSTFDLLPRSQDTLSLASLATILAIDNSVQSVPEVHAVVVMFCCLFCSHARTGDSW